MTDEQERIKRERDIIHLYDFVAQQVLAGLYKSDIIDKLVELGVDQVTASELVSEMERRMKNMLARVILCIMRKKGLGYQVCKEVKYLGFQPFLTQDEATGLNKVRQLVPDLIICDCHLLASHGWDFMKSLRASPIGRKIPVFIFSDRRLQKDSFASFKFVEFIEKPVQVQDICSRIKKIFVLRG